MDFALALTLVLVAAFIGGLLAKKLRQPAILGYLLAGIVVGVLASRVLVEKEVISSLAEISVAFLMFSLGIEFSLKRLTRVRQVALWGGGIQILSVLLLGTILFPRFGFDFYSSLFLAACFSLSSMAVVTKILSERGEIEGLPGEIMVGWLLVQALAVLPMIFILPKVALGLWFSVFLAILKAVTFLALVVFLGKAVVPKIFDRLAKTASREILLLALVGLVSLVVLGTFSLGLSFALGAFLAGLVLSEVCQNHAIFSQIKPWRDIFLIFFLVCLGMMLAPTFFASHLGQIIGVSVVVVIVKLLVVTLLVLYLGYHTKTAFLVGMGLSQVGEFSFILARLGILENLISEDVYSFVISVAVLTIILTPFFFSLAPRIYNRARKWSAKRLPKLYSLVFTRFDERIKSKEISLKDHVVICGHDRVGSWLGRALGMSQIPQVVVDYNFKVVSQAKEREIPVVYGDPADIDVLKKAGVREARAIVIAIPDSLSKRLVIGHVLTLNPKAKLICRAHREEEIPQLKALGVKIIIQPEFEAFLSMVCQILQAFGFESQEVVSKIKRIKIEHGMR